MVGLPTIQLYIQPRREEYVLVYVYSYTIDVFRCRLFFVGVICFIKYLTKELYYGTFEKIWLFIIV